MIPRPTPERFRLRRTMMFLSAQKPGLIKDAYIYGADSLILDLEDAVAENQKDAARFSLYHALKTIDYGDNDLRRELENESRNYNYENESFESMGYQKQEFDDDAEELVSVEEDIELEEDFDESEFAESFDE